MTLEILSLEARLDDGGSESKAPKKPLEIGLENRQQATGIKIFNEPLRQLTSWRLGTKTNFFTSIFWCAHWVKSGVIYVNAEPAEMLCAQIHRECIVNENGFCDYRGIFRPPSFGARMDYALNIRLNYIFMSDKRKLVGDGQQKEMF